MVKSNSPSRLSVTRNLERSRWVCEPADFHRGSEGLQVLPALPLDLLDVRVNAFKRAVFLKELRGGLRPDPVRTRDVV